VQTAEARVDVRARADSLVAALVGVLTFLIAVRPALDNDLWFHLRTARWMLDHHRWVGVDPFTHTRPGVERVQTDWLGQLTLYGSWRVAGLVGVALLVAAICAGAMVLLHRSLDGGVRVRAGVVLLTAAASSIFWSARTQIFTFLGTVLVVCLLRAWRRRPESNLVWLLVPLTLVWTNTHGGVIYGMLLIGATVAGEWGNRLLGIRPLPVEALRRLTLAALASVAVMVVNPSGPRVYGLPFHQVGASVEFVQEYQPPSITDPTAAPFFLLLALTVGLMARRWRQVDLVELFQVAGTALFALRFTRSIPFFAVVAAPVVARHIAALVQERDEPERQPLVVALVAAVVATLVLTGVRLDRGRVADQEAVDFPVGATAWIEANQPEHELFNTFDWGGWVMWELPGYRVSIDGRTDVYDEYLDTYNSVIEAEPGWQAELDREGVGTVLVAPRDPLADALQAEPGWHLGYEDPTAVVFIRTSGAAAPDLARACTRYGGGRKGVTARP
jgi:hypothetical protein